MHSIPPQAAKTKKMHRFSIVAGRVYEMRISVQQTEAQDEILEKSLSVCELHLTFKDTDSQELDLALVCDQTSLPGLSPILVETIPHCDITDAIDAAATTSRFIIAPPDSATLDIWSTDTDIHFLQCDLVPLNILWSAPQAQKIKANVTQANQLRRKILQDHWPEDAALTAVLDVINATPLNQINAIIKRFSPSGDWEPTLAKIGKNIDPKDLRLRLKNLHSQCEDLPNIGFIGSERGYEKLNAIGAVFWIREEEYENQLAALGIDTIIVETANGSGPSPEATDWEMAFSSLDGSLPERGRAFIDAAKDHGIAIHLWITTSPQQAKLWQDCIQNVDRVIADGKTDNWEHLPKDHHVIVQATNPVACSMAQEISRDPCTMLIPVASDIFQYPEFAEFVTRKTVYSPMFAEFRYRFKRHALDERLKGIYYNCIGEHTRRHQRSLLQNAAIVLLPTQSLRTQKDLLNIAIDTIASGGIPVLYGPTPTGPIPVLDMLDRVENPVELMELQALYKIHWVRERQRRKLMRFVMQNHVWKSADRIALLGHDPFEDDFDMPKISAVLVTKRPHLIRKCFDDFRRQSWQNKELILVINTKEMPQGLPTPRKNEHIFLLPESANIGECLNRGIDYASGRYWVKMDDDDTYSSTYIEETAQYYLSTQADIVGRQASYFYFGDENLTRFRSIVFSRSLKILTKGHISGATLSADKTRITERFSTKDRNSADSNWITRCIQNGARTFSADGSSIIVYRNSDESKHTWKIGQVGDGKIDFSLCALENLSRLMEKQ